MGRGARPPPARDGAGPRPRRLLVGARLRIRDAQSARGSHQDLQAGDQGESGQCGLRGAAGRPARPPRPARRGAGGDRGPDRIAPAGSARVDEAGRHPLRAEALGAGGRRLPSRGIAGSGQPAHALLPRHGPDGFGQGGRSPHRAGEDPQGRSPFHRRPGPARFPLRAREAL